MPPNEYDRLIAGDVQEENEYDALIRQEDERTKGAIKRASIIAEKVDPDRWGKVLELSKKQKLNPDFVDRNFEALSQDAALPTENEYDRLIREAPATAQWLAHPDRLAIAKDEIQKIAKLEKQLALLSDPYARPLTQEEVRKESEAAADRRIEAEMKRRMELSPGFFKYRPVTGTGEKRWEIELAVPKDFPLEKTVPYDWLQNPPEKLREKFLTEEIESRTRREAFIGSVEEVGTFEQLGKDLAANPLKPIPFFNIIPEIDQLMRLKEALTARSKRQETPEQLDYLKGWARMEAAAERRGQTVLGMIADFLPSSVAFAGEIAATGGVGPIAKAGAKEGMILATKRMLRELIDPKTVLPYLRRTGIQTLAQSGRTAAGAMRRTLPGTAFATDDQGNVVVNVVSEGKSWAAAIPPAAYDTVVELVTETTGKFFDVLGKPVNRLLFESWASKGAKRTAEGFQAAFQKGGINSVFGEIGEEEVGKIMRAVGGTGPGYALPLTEGGTTGKELAAQFLGFSAFPATTSALSFIGPRAPDRANPELFKRLGDLARDAKSIDRSPEAAEAFVGAVTKGTGAENAYIDVDRWDTLWQSQKTKEGLPVDPRAKAAEIMGDGGEAYDRVKAGNGSDLVIPMPQAIVRLLRTEEGTLFQGEIRDKPLQESGRETKEAVKKEAAARAAEPAAASTAEAESAERVAQGIAEQLRTTKQFTEPEIRKNAVVIEAAFSQLARRGKMSAEQLLQEAGGLRVLGKDVTGPRLSMAAQELTQPPPPAPFGGNLSDDEIDAKYAEIAAEVYSGKRVPQFPIPVGRTPVVLKALGAQDLPVVMPPGLIAEKRKDHLISVDVIRDVPKQLRDPLMVLDSVTVPNSVVVLTEHQVGDKPVIIAVHLNRSESGYQVNKIASVYERENKSDILRWIAEGKLRYWDKGRVDGWLQRNGLQLLAGNQPSIGSVLTKADLVKFEQPGARGGYIPASLTGAEAIIRMTAAKDWSTFQHESAHWYLDLMAMLAGRAETDQALKDDFQKILDWFGVKDLAAWKSLSFEEMRPFHEKWAAGFETYLKEGVAPSSALRKAFAAFKRWMTAIYRRIAPGELTPEIRSVMDRLLASEEAIDAAHAEQEATAPLFEKLKAAGMSEEKAARISEVLEEARLTAEERVTAKLMKEAGKRETKSWKELEASTRAEVALEINARREYVALAVLQTSKMPDGTPLSDFFPAVKLSAANVKERYPDLKLPAGVTAEDGLDPEIAADQFGFSSGEELVRWLAEIERVGQGKLAEATGKADTYKSQFAALKDELETLEKTKAADLLAGKDAIAKRIEKEIRAEERGKLERTVEIVKDIKSRGGVRPTTATELLPEEFTAKKGGGVAADELAQEMSDRGIIKDASADALYDWLQQAVTAIETSKERLASVEKEAKKLAGEKAKLTANAIEANEREQERVKGLLAEATGAKAKIEASVADGGRQAAIDEETRLRMDELRPDSFSSEEALREEAMEAIHNEQRAKVLLLELEYVVSEEFATAKQLLRRIGGRVPKLEDVRAQAEATIGATQVRKVQPHLYQRAEQKAKRAGLEAFGKGDWDGMATALRVEILNHELYRAATTIREETGKALDFLKGIGRKSDEKIGETRDVGIVNAIRAILANYGIGTKGEAAEEYLEQIKRYDEETYATIIETVNAAVADAAVYTDVPSGQFLEMAESVKALWELSLAVNQMTIDGKKTALQPIKDNLITRIQSLTPKQKEEYTRDASTWGKVKISLMGLRAGLRRAEHWAEAMGGDFKKYITQPVLEATTNYRLARKEVREKFLALVKELKGEFGGGQIVAPELGHIFLNKGQLIHAIGHRGNGSNFSKLLRGRGWGKYREDGSLDTSKWDAFEQRMWREGILTKKHYDFAQGLWDLNESLKPGAQQAFKELYGRYFKEVTATPFQTPWGEYRGGYIPAKVDPLLNSDAAINEDKETFDQERASFIFPSTGIGFTKTRKEGYAGPLMLDVRMLASHLDWVLRFTHIQPTVKEVGRILVAKDFRKALDAFDPTIASETLLPFLQRAASQKIEQVAKTRGGKALDWFWRNLRKNVGLNIMFANITNSLQNYTGISVAALRVKPRHLRDATWEFMRDPKGVAQWIRETDPYMMTRTTEQVAQLASATDAILLDANPYQKAKQWADTHGYFMQVATQNQVDNVAWLGAYRQAIEEGKTPEEARREAGSTVRQTQGSGAPEDLSTYEAGTPFQRIFLMFTSYWNMKANLLGTEVAKAARDGGLAQNKARLFYVYMMGALIPSVMATLIYKTLAGTLDDDDDDDGYMDTALEVFFGSQLREGVSLVPVGNMTLRLFERGQLQPSPAISAIERAWGTASSVPKALFEDKREKDAITDFLTLLGLLSGLPVAPAARPLRFIEEE